MKGIYTYIPETNYVPMEYSVAAILLLLIIIIIIIIIIEFFTSQLWLESIHLFWDVVINRIKLGGLICSLKISYN